MDSIRGMQIAQYPLRWVTAPPFEGPDRAAMVGGQDVTEACERGGLVASFKFQVSSCRIDPQRETRNEKQGTCTGGLVASFKSQVVESIRNMKQET